MSTKSSIPSDFYENPSLYGLRRSSRAHNPPDRFQVEEELPRRSRKKSSIISDSSEDDGDDSDQVTNASRRRKQKKPKSKKHSRNSEDIYESFSPYDPNASSAKHNNSSDEDDDDEFFNNQKEASRRSRKRQKIQKSGSSTPQYTPTRFSSRQSKVVNYNIDASIDDADLMDSEDEAYANSNAVQDYIVEDPTGKISTMQSFII